MARRAEHGLTVFEALIMLAITLLAASMILPALGRSVRDDLTRAEQGLRQGDILRGEQAFRAILSGAIPTAEAVGRDPAVFGDDATLRFDADLEDVTVCTAKPGRTPVRVAIERTGDGGALTCVSRDRRAVLAQWTQGAGSFSYGDPAKGWRRLLFVEPDPEERMASHAEDPSFVRFHLVRDGYEDILWIAPAPPWRDDLVSRDDRVERGGGNLDR
ncbi:MAG: hypothetical protein NW200_03225 [Hyphomonadaceae bacterium]|nr:hypothetical protein [Hyphomonadaceae bacterium]